MWLLHTIFRGVCTPLRVLKKLMSYRRKARPSYRPTEAEEAAKALGWRPEPGESVLYVNQYGRYTVGIVEGEVKNLIPLPGHPFLPEWFVRERKNEPGKAELVIEFLIFPILE